MDKVIKQKWVDALRSGEYEQGQGGLYNNGYYCCLGVLCDILGMEKTQTTNSHGWLVGAFRDRQGEVMRLTLTETLSDEIGLNLGEQVTLAGLNDGEEDFSFIAAYIEEIM